MKVSEVMTRGVETISSGATLEEAAKVMVAHNVGFLPVVALHMKSPETWCVSDPLPLRGRPPLQGGQ